MTTLSGAGYDAQLAAALGVSPSRAGDLLRALWDQGGYAYTGRPRRYRREPSLDAR